MDPHTQRRLQLLIDLVHFRNPDCTAQAILMHPESSGQFHITVRSTEDDSEILDFVGNAPCSNEDTARLVAILCHQIDFKKGVEDGSVVRH